MRLLTDLSTSRWRQVGLALLLILALGGCGLNPFVKAKPAPAKIKLEAKSCPTPVGGSAPRCTKPGVPTPTPLPALPTGSAQTQVDGQDTLRLAVTPLGEESSGDSLAFEVRLEGGAAGPGLDLASLAVLETDAGRSVSASRWEVAAEGSPVTGKLYFPAQVEGSPVLAGASQVTLVVSRPGAPARRFTWPLG